MGLSQLLRKIPSVVLFIRSLDYAKRASSSKKQVRVMGLSGRLRIYTPFLF